MRFWDNRLKMDTLIGKTFSRVYIEEPENENEGIVFANEEESYILTHEQDCCEQVDIDDIIGSLKDLVGVPILSAEKSTSQENRRDGDDDWDDSFTWTFFNISTVKGSVTIRFYGQSNGYYSEDADLYPYKD